MRRTLVILAFIAGIALSPVSTSAQGIDPAQESFVSAFLLVRKAEELAVSGNQRVALETYRNAADKLARIKQQWPNWQPDVVDFRISRTTEAIAQLQKSMGAGAADVNPNPAPAGDPGVLPPLPPVDPLDANSQALSAPTPAVVKPGGRNQKQPKAAALPPGADPLEVVKNRISTLESQLSDANERLAAEQQKNEQMASALNEAVEARKKADVERKKAVDLAEVYQKGLLEAKNRGDTESSRVKELESQLSSLKTKSASSEAELLAAEERISQLVDQSRSSRQRAAEAGSLPGKIKQLEAKLAEEQAAKAELGNRLTAMTKERDDAKLEIVRLKDMNKQVDKLMADNAGLLKKLGDAEKLILTFKTESPQKDAEIAALKKQVTDTQKALDLSVAKNTTLQTEVGDLRKKVDEYAKQVQQAKTDKSASAEERRKMEEENKLLQGIVMRVLQEDANRSQRKKMVQKEIDRLQIQSDVLLKQINFLTEPVVKLNSAERRLFKKPIIDVQDPNTIVAIKTDAASEPPASPDQPLPEPGVGASAEAKLPTPEPEKAADAAKPEKPAEMVKIDPTKPTDLPTKEPTPPATESTPPGTAKQANGPAGLRALPEEVRPLAEQAKAAFEGQKYLDAEKMYEKALQLAPNNLYLWSNKGVTQFRAGKFKNAEESFRKAIAIAPEDHFSWCTLGIVEYSQGKYDEAVNALTKSLAINPKNATAHNYLGITAAQKGWQEAAQKELETAIQLDPKYADAWFNLAVTHTLKNPPNKEEAKKAYQKAVELGAEVDPSMENLLK